MMAVIVEMFRWAGNEERGLWHQAWSKDRLTPTILGATSSSIPKFAHTTKKLTTITPGNRYFWIGLTGFGHSFPAVKVPYGIIPSPPHPLLPLWMEMIRNSSTDLAVFVYTSH
jgi:hypothetical protein